MNALIESKRLLSPESLANKIEQGILKEKFEGVATIEKVEELEVKINNIEKLLNNLNENINTLNQQQIQSTSNNQLQKGLEDVKKTLNGLTTALNNSKPKNQVATTKVVEKPKGLINIL